MESLYNKNGLLFWSEEELELRNMFERHFVSCMKENLKTQNKAFEFFKCEAPLLTPVELLNPNYTDQDVWIQNNPFDSAHFTEFLENLEQHKERMDAMSKEHMRTGDNSYFEKMKSLKLKMQDAKFTSPLLYSEMVEIYEMMFPATVLVLRPETTMGSYAYAKHLLNAHNERKVSPPLVVYQHGKSFRREQDQATKFMRLKEFYQLEFQAIYSNTTKSDYSIPLIPAVHKMISDMIGECRIEDSDRIPSYAEWTKDVVCEKSNMEVCSISKRKDYDGMNVLEVAIGTDRCIYNFKNK